MVDLLHYNFFFAKSSAINSKNHLEFVRLIFIFEFFEKYDMIGETT
jgi:hypothetical protein